MVESIINSLIWSVLAPFSHSAYSIGSGKNLPQKRQRYFCTPFLYLPHLGGLLFSEPHFPHFIRKFYHNFRQKSTHFICIVIVLYEGITMLITKKQLNTTKMQTCNARKITYSDGRTAYVFKKIVQRYRITLHGKMGFHP